jgi:hypothetical protein
MTATMSLPLMELRRHDTAAGSIRPEPSRSARLEDATTASPECRCALAAVGRCPTQAADARAWQP